RGCTLLRGWGRDGRETFPLRRPRSWGVALGLAVLLVFAMLIVAAALEPVLHAGEAQGLDPPGWDADRAPARALAARLGAGVCPRAVGRAARGPLSPRGGGADPSTHLAGTPPAPRRSF